MASNSNLTDLLRRWRAGESIKILPFGDSLTAGTSTFAGWRDHFRDIMGYRGYSFDTVGSQTGQTQNLNPYHARDYDHEGNSGLTLTSIAAIAEARASTYQPDLILACAGANDTDTSDASIIATRTRTILANLRTGYSGVPIVFMSRPPRRSAGSLGMDGFIAAQVIGVRDGCIGYNDVAHIAPYPNMSRVWTTEWHADDTHYNNLGYRVMAEMFARYCVGEEQVAAVPKIPASTIVRTTVAADYDIPQGAQVAAGGTAVVNCVFRDGTTQAFTMGTNWTARTPLPGWVTRIKSSGSSGVDASNPIYVSPLPMGVIH